jgi:hypothetical protein
MRKKLLENCFLPEGIDAFGIALKVGDGRRFFLLD